ncbi:MAG: Uma2 family endonuclease [Xenococcus sp. (in: cyanobacteria)]
MVANKSAATTPPLENGDRLNSYEFERRYAAMPNLNTAELIEGVVYVPAALRFKSHGQPHANIIGWLWFYKIATPKVELGDNATVRLDLDNVPQPDAILIIDGGQASISADDYVEGAPELIVEVAASSAAYDLYDKKRAYRRNGVKEYLVWRVYDQEFDWFYLEKGEYIKLSADDRGVIRSVTFPGLWLSVSALLSGKMKEVLAILQQGLNSEEYQKFTRYLAE